MEEEKSQLVSLILYKTRKLMHAKEIVEDASFAQKINSIVR